MEIDEKDLLKVSGDEIASITEFFKAIAHPKRLSILNLLALEGLCDFSRLKKLTELSKTALANHLSQLESLRLIKRVERGHYEITEDGKNLVHNAITLYKKTQFSNESERQLIGQEYIKFSSNIRMLGNIKFRRYWVSHLASLHGCLEYLGVDISKPWLYGVTGHAFIINMRDQACPSGPTAWKNDMILDLGNNIGITIERFYAEPCEPDYENRIQNGWDFVRSSLKKDSPCYGWQIGDIREFYIIYGFDNIGYYYKGYFQEEGAGPKPWKDIGKMHIALYSVKKDKKSADSTTQVKSALQKVLRHSKNPSDWIYKPEYSSGIQGFDRWINWVENGRAEQFGQAYNSQIWTECRQEAVKFLQEAKNRLINNAKPYLDKAIKHYKTVANNLTKLAKLYPFDMDKLTIEPIGINEKSKTAVNLLKNAREAELKGLSDLKEIIEIL